MKIKIYSEDQRLFYWDISVHSMYQFGALTCCQGVSMPVRNTMFSDSLEEHRGAWGHETGH